MSMNTINYKLANNFFLKLESIGFECTNKDILTCNNSDCTACPFFKQKAKLKFKKTFNKIHKEPKKFQKEQKKTRKKTKETQKKLLPPNQKPIRVVEPIRDIKLVQEIEKRLRKDSIRNQLIWEFGINTGLRISDLLALNVEDVLGKESITLREIKTKKLKTFPLNNKLKSLIEEYLKTRKYSIDKNNPLFVGSKHHRLDTSSVYRIINKVCAELGIKENVGTHTMRKTFGYHHYKKFKDVAMLQEIFNHFSPQVTLRYIGICQDEINLSYMNFEL